MCVFSFPQTPVLLSRGRVTKDDLKLKAMAALQNFLPKMWRVSRCRKRHRTVSTEEMPWRAQVN